MGKDKEKDERFVVLIPASKKEEIDSEINKKCIRKYSNAYRQIVDLGFEAFKKIPKKV